ncbi:MAG: hypothetical protein WC184_05485 [Acidimicrobiia bacterium]
MLFAAVGDTSYNFMLLLHILAAIVGFSPAWLWPILVRLNVSGDLEAGRSLEATIVRFSLPGLVLSGLLGFGIAGMSDKVFKMSQTWLMVAALLWIVLVAVYAAVARPAAKKLAEGDMNAQGTLGMATGVSHLILVVILYLMVFKPGF